MSLFGMMADFEEQTDESERAVFYAALIEEYPNGIYMRELPFLIYKAEKAVVLLREEMDAFKHDLRVLDARMRDAYSLIRRMEGKGKKKKAAPQLDEEGCKISEEIARDV